MNYNIQYRIAGATAWSAGISSVPSFSISGLTSATNYEWQVQAVCSADATSSFTASTTFTTLSGITCAVPSGLSVSSVSATSATLLWAATSASNYNLQWKMATASQWTTLSGVTAAAYNLSGLTSCTGYQFQVQSNCSGTLTAYSSSVSFTTTGCASSSSYCASTGVTVNEYINAITITNSAGTLTNTSGDNKGYADFTNLNAIIKGGSTTTMKLTAGFPGAHYTEYWTVYIDYNHNGTFTDAGERVFTDRGSKSSGVLNKTFTVPTTALNGVTRMKNYPAVFQLTHIENL